MIKRLAVVGSIAIAMSVVACGDDQSVIDPNGPTQGGQPGAPAGPGGGPMQYNQDGVPIGPDGQPLAPQLHGKYELYNQFDLTTTGILPDVMNDVLKALSEFREKPSATIVALLDAAKVPIVSQVMAVIPGAIKDLVFGYIDDHVFKSLYQAVPVVQQLTGMLDDMASIITQFELVTTLDMPEGDAMGDARSTHSIKGIAYNWNQTRHVIDAPELVAQLTAQTAMTNAVALEHLSSQQETGRLKIRDHKFSIPVGSFAVYGINMLATDKFGAASVRELVGRVVDCHALAVDVSNRCITAGPAKVCVGHESDIENLCTTGLDIIVAVALGQIKDLDIPLLYLTEGDAQMWDAPAEGGPLDAIVSRIDRGFWTAKINAGSYGEKPVIATFTGKRL